MYKRWNCETEDRDLDIERHAVAINHLIVTLHGAQRRFDNRAAGILILFAGRDVRLFADHPFTLDFRLATVSIGDKPVAAEKLNHSPLL